MLEFILSGWESTFLYNRHSEDFFSNRNEIFQTKLKVSLLSLSTHQRRIKILVATYFLMQYIRTKLLIWIDQYHGVHNDDDGRQLMCLSKRAIWVPDPKSFCKLLNMSWFMDIIFRNVLFLLTFSEEKIILLILQRYPIMRAAMLSFRE